MKITVQMARDHGYCAKGIRRWADSNGLDFTDFVQNGIEVEKIIQFKDDPFIQVILSSIEGYENGWK